MRLNRDGPSPGLTSMINKELEAVAQHDGRHDSRQLRAPGCEPGCHPSCQRQLGNLRCPGEKYFVEQRQSIHQCSSCRGSLEPGLVMPPVIARIARECLNVHMAYVV